MKTMIPPCLLLFACCACYANGQVVSYQKQVAPIFANQCGTCHGAPTISSDKPSPPGGLDTTTFQSLMRGGTTGKVIDIASPELSQVLRKPSGAEKQTCDSYRDRARKSPMRATVQGVPPTEKEAAACKITSHPYLGPGDAATVLAWIKLGAEFDAEPVPKNCVRLNALNTGKNGLLSIYFRSLKRGLATLTAFEHGSNKIIATLSDNTERFGAGSIEEFLLDSTMPQSVDVSVCLPYVADPYGLLVATGPEERDDLDMTSVDPPVATIGDWKQVTFTTWQSGSGKAQVHIENAETGKPVFDVSELSLERGLNRIAWDLADPKDGEVAPASYIAYLTVKRIGEPASSTTMGFLIQIAHK